MIDAATVRALLELIDLQVPESRIAEVTAQFQRIETIAAPVLAASLEPHDEPAPVWRP
jgi:Asp-tRNA(Asn)/Glu-tRNA(Gln) amidotransferase C subunit